MATVITGYPVKEYKSGYTRLITQVTLANSEAYALDHADLKDADKLRKVTVINNGTGAYNLVSAAGLVSIVLTDADTTTITVGASAAGTYNIIIEL
jgi:hypothetical protein